MSYFKKNESVIFNGIKKFAGNRVFQHTLFWLFSFVVLLNLFKGSARPEKIDYIYTALFHVWIFPFVYINLSVLIPSLLSHKKYLLYALSLVVLIPVAAQLNILLFDRWIDTILPGYYFISYYSFFDIIKFMVAYLSVTTLLKLSRGWFRLSEATLKLSELQKENAEAELKVLKSQINPHFLFNSLNSVYSLALNNSEKTPETILKLSEILRYVIYETGNDFISLSKEIKYLMDYIDLQKIRSDSRAVVTIDLNGETDGIMIAPMLLLPLVENSFKHGVKGSAEKPFIKIEVLLTRNDFYFSITNNKGVVDDVDLKDYKGIGIDNVRKRLEMIYAGNHEFNVTDNDDTFKVEILIKDILKQHED